MKYSIAVAAFVRILPAALYLNPLIDASGLTHMLNPIIPCNLKPLMENVVVVIEARTVEFRVEGV